jgi:hypothetical protein
MMIMVIPYLRNMSYSIVNSSVGDVCILFSLLQQTAVMCSALHFNFFPKGRQKCRQSRIGTISVFFSPIEGEHGFVCYK